MDKDRKSFYSIRSKLSIVFALVLVLNFLMTLFFGQALFQKLYTSSKIRELKQIKADILQGYPDNSEMISNAIRKAETRNITVLLFTYEHEVATIEYFSRDTAMISSERRLRPMLERLQYNPRNWIQYAYTNGIIEELENNKVSEIFMTSSGNFMMQQTHARTNISIQLYSKSTGGTYIFLETPKEAILQAANLAVRYTSLISLITMFIGILIIAFISKTLTKPILQIKEVAAKISHLDFSQKCTISGNDEIGQLSNDINSMSETLQQNIHALQETNIRLQEDLNREEKTNTMRKDFIANVSHDFKTPIALILAYSESLRDNILSDENVGIELKTSIQSEIKIIEDESKKMDKLVNQLLRLSQLESKILEVKEETFCVTSLINDLIHKNEILIQNAKASLVFNENEKYVVGDYLKTEQMLGNLLENAMKYSSGDKVIKISYDDKNITDEKIKIQFSNYVNDGEVLEPEKLFISFYKEDISRTIEEKSYGLGLAIVRAIAGIHGNSCGATRLEKEIVFWVEIKKAFEN